MIASQDFIAAACFSVLAALGAAIAIVMTKKWHGGLSMDSEEGIQKVHDTPTPRVGGVALAVGLLVGTTMLSGEAGSLMVLILACALPAFIAGFVEDTTKAVSPRVRLFAALASGGLFLAFGNSLAPLAGPLTPAGAPAWAEVGIYVMGGIGITIGLAGTTNAINLIDGFHGLAAGSLLIMSVTIAILAGSEEDFALAAASAVFAASVLGFMVVNFPGGYLFLGDAGAYLSGFVLGALALLLAARTDISAFVSILIMAHPVYETLFSIMRRIRRGALPMQPDGMHLHTLVSRRYARFIAYGLDKPQWKNPLTGALMWPFSFVASCLAIFAQGTNLGGIIGLLVFMLFYARVYRVVSLQRPSFLQDYAKRHGWDEAARYRPRPHKEA